MCCIHGKLKVSPFLGLIFQQPVVGQSQTITEQEIVQSTVSIRPSSFGSGGLACHCFVDSLDTRSDKKLAVGRKS